MKLYLYTSKFSLKEGVPRWIWMRRCRWYLLRRENSERFKITLEALEGRECPMAVVGSAKHPEGYLVLKIAPIKDVLGLLVPDLVYHACLSTERLYSLEEREWGVLEINSSPRLLALYYVGSQTLSDGRFNDAKDLFKSILKQLTEKEGKGGN
jgi:hypothetical protein